jgi:DNA-binding MarR family transcriptional regulator
MKMRSIILSVKFRFGTENASTESVRDGMTEPSGARPDAAPGAGPDIRPNTGPDTGPNTRPDAGQTAEGPETQPDMAPDMTPMLEAKLWRNPCWFAFRLNYLALRYNLPLYDWVRRTYGLSRPEYVALYSLALSDGGRASDIVATSGFPKNTLSRAVRRLEDLGLIAREASSPGGRRGQALHLSPAGDALFRETLPAFERQERMMLAGLSHDEHATLSRLMAKVVMTADAWPTELPDGPPAASPDAGQAAAPATRPTTRPATR